MPQSRWRSPVLWTSIFALLFFVLKTFGLLQFIGLDQDTGNQLVALIVAVLAALGVINNPTDSQNL